MRASVYSVSVAATPGFTPNSSSSERELLDLSRTPPALQVLQQGREVGEEAHRVFDGSVKRTRLLAERAPSRMRASCSAGPLELRDAARIPNIAGFETARRWSGRRSSDFDGCELASESFHVASTMVQVSAIPADHFPGMSQFCLPPRLHPLDSNFFIILHRNFRPSENSRGRGAAKSLARTRSDHEASTDLEKRLALHRYTARSHRHRAQSWCAFARGGHQDGVERHACGLEGESSSSPVRLSPTALCETDKIAPVRARMVKWLATRTKDGACRLEPGKEQCSARRTCMLVAVHGRE